MPLLPQFDTQTSTAVQMPMVEISFGGGDGGGFGGLVDATSDLLGTGGDSSWAQYLVELRISQGLAPRVDMAELLLAQQEGTPEAAIGDEGQIRLGPAGALADLFKGRVIAIERRSDRLRRYRLASGSQILAQTRINQSVTNMSVADAISYAANEAGLSVETDLSGSDGTLPQYAFDDGRSLWQHMAYLAGLRGASLWFDAGGNLHLGDDLGSGDPVTSLSHGDNLLETNLWQRTPHSGAVTVFGGGLTDDGHTLRKQAGPNTATSGQGVPQRFYRDGALLAQADLSGRATAAGLAGSWRSTAGELLASGSSSLIPGGVVEVGGLPEGGDGRYLVLAAEHRFDRRTGWRSHLSVAAAESSGGLGSLGGLP